MSNASVLYTALAMMYHHPGLPDIVVVHKGTSCGPSTLLHGEFDPCGLYLEGMIVIEDPGSIREAPTLEAILEERDYVLEYMAVPDVPVLGMCGDKENRLRRSGQKTRPHWPNHGRRK